MTNKRMESVQRSGKFFKDVTCTAGDSAWPSGPAIHMDGYVM